MRYWEQLSPEQRAEVDAAVHDAYVRDDGSIRTHEEAQAVFDSFIADAIQAHKQWAGVLLDGWREDGRRSFLKRRWKDSKVFGLIHKGLKRRRSAHRGTRVRNEEGQQQWVQAPLIDWTADQLLQAIRDESKDIEERKANIAMYRALLNLLSQTGQATVRQALVVLGTSLEEYLADVDAQRRAA